jgi:two-component system chemotaxis response regulator CheY
MEPCILVVDDNRIYREAFCTLLYTCLPFVRILSVEDGSTALRIVEQQDIHLIVLDYQLQGISGSDVVRRLRARSTLSRPLPPIVLMSSQPDAAIFARTLGIAAFLHKPSSVDDIRTVVEPLIDRARSSVSVPAPRLWHIKPKAS